MRIGYAYSSLGALNEIVESFSWVPPLHTLDSSFCPLILESDKDCSPVFQSHSCLPETFRYFYKKYTSPKGLFYLSRFTSWSDRIPISLTCQIILPDTDLQEEILANP